MILVATMSLWENIFLSIIQWYLSVSHIFDVSYCIWKKNSFVELWKSLLWFLRLIRQIRETMNPLIIHRTSTCKRVVNDSKQMQNTAGKKFIVRHQFPNSKWIFFSENHRPFGENTLKFPELWNLTNQAILPPTHANQSTKVANLSAIERTVKIITRKKITFKERNHRFRVEDSRN